MSKTTEIMEDLRTLSRQATSFEIGLEMYLRLLDLLNHTEVIHSQSRVDYPAIGADLFPFLYANNGWTWDTRLTLSMVKDAFRRLTQSSLPRREFAKTRTAPVQHFRDSFLTNDTLSRWSNTLQGGDVLFLKHAREYFVAQHPIAFPKWMANMGDAVPRGVRVVLFEPQVSDENGRDKMLSLYFTESGRFEDITGDLLGARAYRKLRAVNQRVLEFNRELIRSQVKCNGCALAHCVGCNELRNSPQVFFDAISALTVLERR